VSNGTGDVGFGSIASSTTFSTRAIRVVDMRAQSPYLG